MQNERKKLQMDIDRWHLENYQTRFRFYQVGSDGSTVSPSWVSIEDGNVWFSGNFMYETNS